MLKRALIITNPKTKITMEETVLITTSIYGVQMIGFHNISAVYCHKECEISINIAYNIAKKIPFFFIDAHQNILAKISFKL